MELLKILFVTALCVAGSIAKIEEEDGIVIVTKDNFEEVLEDTYVLIEFCEYYLFIYLVIFIPAF